MYRSSRSVTEGPVDGPAPAVSSSVSRLKKFAIPEQKQLIVELYEKGGGRNIKLKLTNSDLLKARTFR